MKTSRLVVAAAAALLPLSVACGGSEDIAANDPTSSSTSPTATTTPPTPTVPTAPSVSVTSPTDEGARLEGTGYSVVIPDGWEDITGPLRAQNPRLDVAMGESEASGFRTNLNVVRTANYTATIEENGPAIRREAAAELKSITKTSIRSLADRAIADDAAIGQTSTFVASGTSVTFQQYVVVHDQAAYSITMTSAAANRAAATSLLAKILASWQWTS